MHTGLSTGAKRLVIDQKTGTPSGEQTIISVDSICAPIKKNMAMCLVLLAANHHKCVLLYLRSVNSQYRSS